jgi:HEPN domain-containing protein
MNRADLQQLSNARIREAKILLAAGEYSGAYYLAGYAVECALKSCYAKSIKRYDFPDKAVTKVFIHSLKDLTKVANVDSELDLAIKADSQLETNWVLVRVWSEQSRYAIWTREDAAALVQAIISRKGGVLPWIRQRW